MFGDGPIYATVAHEVAHAAQSRFNHDHESGAIPAAVGQHSVGAAGRLSGRGDYREGPAGRLPHPDARRGARIALATQFENVAGDHGTDDQRVAAFDLGHGTGDVETCLYNKGVSPYPSVI